MVQAWSSIVYELIPNVHELEHNLKTFAHIIDADEVLLFERATFLIISHYHLRPHKDLDRFERVSNIIKQFKLSCRSVTIALKLSVSLILSNCDCQTLNHLGYCVG